MTEMNARARVRPRTLPVLFTALLVLCTMLVPGLPATAANGPDHGFVRNVQTWYAYVEAGDTISSSFVKERQGSNVNIWDPAIVVTRPDGTVADSCAAIALNSSAGTECDFNEVATVSGVWSVSIKAPAGASPVLGRQWMTWDITVSNGAPIEGRVWTEQYRQVDTPLDFPAVDLSMWVLTEHGYIYRVDRPAMNGIDSVYDADAFGVVDKNTCASAHTSTSVGVNFESGNPQYSSDFRNITETDCDFTPYKLFFEAPSADLPEQVTLPSGTATWLSSAPVEPNLQQVSFAQESVGSRSGTVHAQIANFEGSATVQIDVDGDGVFGGTADREFRMAVVGGAGEGYFDGRDAEGNAIPVTSAISFRVLLDSFAEVHFTDTDVEYLPEGISVTRLNGPADGTESRIFWDDSIVTSTDIDHQANMKCSTTPQLSSGPNGVDSTAGVHGWDLGSCLWSADPRANAASYDTANGGSWGNNRQIDDWALIDFNEQEDIFLPAAVPGLAATKSSNPASGSNVSAGQQVIYTLTYTNTGDAPANVDSTDDLSDVLDDADVSAEPASDVNTVIPKRDKNSLRISGALAPGATAKVTYTVTVRADGARGDNLLDNVLTPDDPDVCQPRNCATSHKVGELEMSKSSDPASESEVAEGDKITYTLRFANTGKAPVAVDAEDALSGVLDDAKLVDAPKASDAALTVGKVVDGRFSITGTLQPGQEATVSYSVSVLPQEERGDGVLGNFLVKAGADAVCNTSETNCTHHPVRGTSALAMTGTTPSAPLPAVLLLLGGGMLLAFAVRRRIAS